MTITLDGSNANTVGVINSATAQNATGTSVNFTGIPAGIKRITVMFSGVSTNGTSLPLIQIGSGSFSTSGYASYGGSGGTSGGGANATTGFLVNSANSANLISGHAVLTLSGSNTWVSTITIGYLNGVNGYFSITGGYLALSGTLDRVRITTVNGTDTFDAGSINILYE